MLSAVLGTGVKEVKKNSMGCEIIGVLPAPQCTAR